MNRSLLWRGLLILLLVVALGVAAYPPKEKINLGLDLQGGMHLVLGVQVEDAFRAETERYMQQLAEEAGDEGIGVRGERRDDTTFVLSGVPADRFEALEGLAADLFGNRGDAWTWFRQGSDLVVEMTERNVNLTREQTINQALQTIRNRVDAFGVAEPVIQRVGIGGGNRIVIQLPGIDDPERVRRLIKSTAFLEFRLVEYPSGGGGARTREDVLANYGGRLPDHVELLEQDIRDDSGRLVSQAYYAVEKNRVITGRDLKSARPGLGQFNDPIVQFSLTRDGAERFGEVTGANVGRGLAIILDNKVVSAPNINSRITDSGQIEGQFTQQEVEDLSTVLRTGSLPAGMTYLEERTVGPSLGRDSIDQGLRAGLIGGLLVIFAMLAVYKLTGINAVIALGLDVVLVFGALAYFGATLTLPGIAGIILTVGMAVDANVLVFERIKEELRLGRTVKSAIDSGFSKALSSILDANVTTLIAALFLFQFGTGPIRGFAVTLSIGILASVFTAVFVSRFIFELILSRPGRVEKLSI